MWTSRLFWKTFGVYTALTVAAVATFTTLVANRLRKTVVEDTRDRLHDLALVLLQRDVTGGLRAAPTEEWLQRLRLIGHEHGVRVTVVASDGTVVGDSRYDASTLENQALRPEVRRALDEGFGVAERTSHGSEQMFVAHLVPASRESVRGVVRMAVPMDDVRSEIADVQRPVFVTAAVLTFFGIAFTYLILRRIVVPVRQVTAAARAMAEGNVEQHVDVRTGDELQTLAESFNATSRDLARRIDQLRRKSADVEANSERLETVLGAMVEGVLAVDAEERILFANAAARRMLGEESKELVGRAIWEAVWHASVQGMVATVLRAEDGDARLDPVEIELAGRQLEFSPRRLPGTNPGLVLVIHDVTNLRRLENLRTDFVQNVSHELKTPLTLIQLDTETLLEWALEEDPAHARELAEHVVEQCERLNALVQDLLHLARLDSERDVFELGPVSIGDVVAGLVRELNPVATSTGIDLRTEPPTEDVEVLADEQGLRTIVENLVTNALRYTSADGRVTVRWGVVEPGEVRLEVEDTGIGIPAADQPRVFERFYRVDPDRSRDAGGTGLGLSIVKHLSQRFGGSVSLHSVPRVGSTFAVRLPVLQSATVDAAN